MVQLSHSYMTTGNSIDLTINTVVLSQSFVTIVCGRQWYLCFIYKKREALRSKINYPTSGSNLELESNSRSLLMKFSVSLLSGNY